MNQMTIEKERGKPAERLDFIAWKDGCFAFYARPHNGNPRVITLEPISPEETTWKASPLSELAPIIITRCRLIPPPIRESVADCESQYREQWEVVYWDTHRQMLYLDSKDEKPLLKLLAAYTKAARADYERERKDAGRTTDQAERAARMKQIEHEYTTPLHKFDGIECAGTLNMTLAMVKRGCGDYPGDTPGLGCIRDAYLVKGWAEREGIDLSEMARRRGEFLKWIYKHRAIPDCFYGKDDPRFLELCAGVRYRVEFADGTAAFLADYTERSEIRPEELKEIKEIEPTQNARPCVEFRNHCTEIRGTSPVGGSVIMRNRLKPKILKYLYNEHTKAPEEWHQWDAVKRACGVTSNEADPRRFFETRGGDRHKQATADETFSRIIETNKVTTGNIITYRIRLNPEYNYQSKTD